MYSGVNKMASRFLQVLLGLAITIFALGEDIIPPLEKPQPIEGAVVGPTDGGDANEVGATALAEQLPVPVISEDSLDPIDPATFMLLSFRCTAQTVNVLQAPQTLTCLAKAAKADSNIQSIYGAFYNAVGTKSIPFYMTAKNIVDNTNNIPTYGILLNVPKGIDQGTWTLGLKDSSHYIKFQVTDKAGNVQKYSSADVAAFGANNFQKTLVIRSTPGLNVDALVPSSNLVPSSGPKVTDIACDLETVTLNQPILLRCYVKVVNDGYGVDSVDMHLVSPNGKTVLSYLFEPGPNTSVNATSVVMSATQFVPIYSESGIYQPAFSGGLALVSRSLAGTIRRASPTDLNKPYNLTISAKNIDTKPPAIASLVCNIGATDTILLKTDGPTSIACTADMSDDLSGIASVSFVFVGPSKDQAISFSYGPQTAGLKTDQIVVSNLRIRDTKVVSIDDTYETGAWTLGYVLAVDNAGNYKQYLPSELTQAKMRTFFFIESPLQVKQVDPPKKTQPPAMTATSGSASLSASFTVILVSWIALRFSRHI